MRPLPRERALASLLVISLLFAGRSPLNADDDSVSIAETRQVAPVFSPAGGVFSAESVRVSIEAGSEAAVVRFTLDGSEPTERSEVFAKGLILMATTLVRARIFEAGKPVGPITSETYTFIDSELARLRSNLPVVILNTFGREIERAVKIPASARFIDVRDGSSSLSVPADFDGRGDVNLRGNTSLRYLKRSFTFKTRNEDGQSRAVSILGLPKDSDWVLYAPYPDKTLIRDVLAYDLSRQMGHYASRTKFVELFLNQVGGRMTMRHYMGVYVLAEKIKRGKDRVNLHKLGLDDNAMPNITGGYIFKKDHWDSMENVKPTVEGRPSGFGGSSGSRSGYPTGPEGFPGDPAGFLPPLGGPRRSGRIVESGRAGINSEPADRSMLENLQTLVGPPPDQPVPQRPGNVRQFREVRDPATGERRMVEITTGGREGVIMTGRQGRGLRDSGGRPGDEAFRTVYRNEFFYVEPKDDEITPAQKQWLQGHLNEFERVLYGPDFRDPIKGYAAYLDVDSFIDQHLIVEVTKNIDGFRFSTFYQKDRGGKIKMDPIWDWNLSFGNCNGKQGWMPEYWYWPQLDDNQYTWFRRLFEDPDFGQRYVDRWGELRQTVFSSSNMLGKVDALVRELGDARIRNFKRWPILGRAIWPNKYVGETYDDEINFLKDFIRKRLAWIDRQFVPAPSAVGAGGLSDGGRSVTLAAPSGRIYYTVDGSDPRASGGGISPSARVSTSPIELPRDGRLFARALLEGRWSPPARL